MPTLTIYRGLPGSGKSTDAKREVAKARDWRARVNRDDTRRMLHDGFGSKATERQVTIATRAAIKALLLAGFDVYCDDTNLIEEHFNALIVLAAEAGAVTEVRDFRFLNLDVVIDRDSRRTGDERLGGEKIKAMFDKHIAPLLSGPGAVMVSGWYANGQPVVTGLAQQGQGLRLMPAVRLDDIEQQIDQRRRVCPLGCGTTTAFEAELDAHVLTCSGPGKASA